MDHADIPSVKLNNGLNIPIIGLGTHQFSPTSSIYRAVRDAIDNGYRHFSFPYAFKNDGNVGKAITDAIKEGKVKREELFIESKLWLTHFEKDGVNLSVKNILAKLNTPYLDLCSIHWPQMDNEEANSISLIGSLLSGETDYLNSWRQLEECVGEGLIKSIGVSNFDIKNIDRLLKSLTIKPVTNQIQCHPYLAQNELKKFCEMNHIILTAFAPLGNPGKPEKRQLLTDPAILRLAQKYYKSAAQILIKFQIQRGVIVIIKTVHLDQIMSNIQIFDFNLTDGELQELELLQHN